MKTNHEITTEIVDACQLKGKRGGCFGTILGGLTEAYENGIREGLRRCAEELRSDKRTLLIDAKPVEAPVCGVCQVNQIPGSRALSCTARGRPANPAKVTP